MKAVVLNGRISRADLRNIMSTMDVGDYLSVTNDLTARNALNRVDRWFGEEIFIATVHHDCVNSLLVKRVA